ncbi:type I secretion system permease/ATPase [Rodentibacter haemolyticus]|uniref:Type I secretion system permease/ATPase n=1 Tax=Rodentibacter haemolyticus TaxID=2778911 RepID=A0ABX6UXQ9_9PAST|nr:type I secretion system permease/ATPase [Rodentibacter haemolyticus]QPB42637.1 type I secretion system permease/ATPase [Rodentibacter haemolyticus]
MKSIIEHLALVTQLQGNPVSHEALTAQVERDNHLNVNLASLGEILRTYGFENTISKRKLADIPSLATPVMVMLTDNEAAVVTKIDGVGNERKFTVRQIDNVEKVLTFKELNARYLGYCWFVKPKMTADVRSELPEYDLPKAWFWKVIWRFKAYYGQVVLATFIINFLALVSSLYVMNVYDRVIPNKTYETLWALSIGVILAISFEFVAKMIRGHLTDIAGKKADLIISSALFRRVMALRLIDKPASSGSYANNLRDFESVREFMTSASLLVLVDLPFLLLFVFVIFLIGGMLAIVPLIIIPTVIIVGILVQPKLAARINESMRESSQRQGLVVEALDGIETLKANNATSWAQHRWDAYTAKTSASQIKVKDLSNFIVNFSTGLQQLNTVFLVLLGTYLIHSPDEASRITMGALIASVILSGRALAPLGQIAGLATRFQQARLALKGVDDIVNRPIERDVNRKYITLQNTKGMLTFKNTAFQYNKDLANALSDVNINIRAGEKVAILGRVGSGKSTLLKLASGLYEPLKGNVSLDGVDIRQIEPTFLRNQIALLGQQPRLFLGTLRENLDIARVDNFSTDQELVDALNRFQLGSIVNNHPRGLDMPLGENGQGLSGGQKQLVALARLTIKDPRIVLLDEPTSDLDQGSEEMVLQALSRWIGNRTMVVVTHRPQVLKLVNRIIVMDNGQVAIDGPRDAVLKHLSDNEKKQAEAQQKQQIAQQQANKKQEQPAMNATTENKEGNSND